MNNWLDAVVKHEQQKDVLREVERRRLVAEARAGHKSAPAVARLGRRLAAWYRGLKVWYGTAAARPALNDR